MLSSNWETPVKRLAQQHPQECLKAWLLERTVPELGLVHSDVNESWRAVLRKLFAGWQPSTGSPLSGSSLSESAARVVALRGRLGRL